ncbi:F5U2 [Hyposoter didymator ichnovirus]|nr:F5U2 [Hyposoter didymator ichnovirus]
MSLCSEHTKTVSIASPIYFSCINQLTICYMQLIHTHWNCDRQDCMPGLCSASLWTAECNTLRTLRYVHENPTVSIHQYRSKESAKKSAEAAKQSAEESRKQAERARNAAVLAGAAAAARAVFKNIH